MQIEAVNRDEPLLRHLLTVLRRHTLLAFGVATSIIALGALYIFTSAPTYNATAYLEANFRVLPADAKSNRPSAADAEAIIRTQTEIIVTRIVPQVVDMLNLTSDPEFNLAIPQKNGIGDYLSIARLKASIKAFVAEKLGLVSGLSLSAEEQRNRVVAAVRQKLNATDEKQSHVIIISFSSKDPKKAARIVNTIAEQLIYDQLRLDREQNDGTAHQITIRLDKARQRLIKAEVAAQRYREGADLLPIGREGLTAVSQQMSQFNVELVKIEVERAQAEAELRQADQILRSGAIPDSIGVVLNSPLIWRLTEKQAELRQKEAGLSRLYGPQYPKMVDIEAELSDTNNKMIDEVRKISSGLVDKLAQVRQQEEILRSKIGRLEQQLAKNSRAAVEGQQLQREADSAQHTYDELSAQLNVVHLRNDLGMPEARIIHLADTPVWPEPPGRSLQLMIIVLLAGVAAVIVALLRDGLDRRLWSAADVEGIGGERVVAFLPTSGKRGSTPERSVIDEPDGYLAQALLSVRTELSKAAIMRRPMLIVTTSAVPEEGKTTVAISLARVLARWGHRVLLIDADLRAARIGKLLNSDGRGTIDDVLNGKMSFREVIQVDHDTGVHYIVAPSSGADERLFSAATVREVRLALHDYDVILFDTMPVIVAGATDAVLSHSDYVLFLVRWGKIPVQVAKDALWRIRDLNPNTKIGVIFSRVNLKKLAKYDPGYAAYYHQAYGNYYRRKERHAG